MLFYAHAFKNLSKRMQQLRVCFLTPADDGRQAHSTHTYDDDAAKTYSN